MALLSNPEAQPPECGGNRPPRALRFAQHADNHLLGGFARMDKQPITPRSHKKMIREYPITGLLEGWYFRQREVSAGCYVVEGSDVYGRTISRQTTADPDAALAECVAFARQSVQTHGGHNAA